MLLRVSRGKYRLVPTPTFPLVGRPACRAFSSEHIAKEKTVILESGSLNPYFNLALEDWLFRTAEPDQAILLFYRNSPCVVVGRNQNPWKEINFHALRNAGVPFVRRHSGGGTVYHDEGNTNYSISIPRAIFDRRTNAELVARGLVSLGVKAYVNERNDVTVGGFKIGSAYKIANKRAYHHGTMLISAQLHALGDLLRNNKDTMVTKGVDSVRSAVRNIQDFVPEVKHHRFTHAVAMEFLKTYGTNDKLVIKTVLDEDTEASNEAVQKRMAELKTWDWTYGQTPEFTHELSKEFEWGRADVHIHSKKGIILDSTIRMTPAISSHSSSAITPAAGEELAKRFVGTKYGFPDAAEVERILNGSNAGIVERQLIEWLKEDM